MINGDIGHKTTNITNVLKDESFEKVFETSKDSENVFNLDIFKNKDMQKYLEQNFNPEDHKEKYKDFTKQRLLLENKNNIKKYIKIHTFVNSKQWDELWENVA